MESGRRLEVSKCDLGTAELPVASGPPLDLSQLTKPTRDEPIHGLMEQVHPIIDESNSHHSYSETPGQGLGKRHNYLEWASEVWGHSPPTVSSPGPGLLDIWRSPASYQDENSVMLQPDNIVTAGMLEVYAGFSYPKQPPSQPLQDETVPSQARQSGRHPDFQLNRPDPEGYDCPCCSKSFVKKQHLLRHLRQRTSFGARRIARLTPCRCRGEAFQLQFLLQILKKKARSLAAAVLGSS